MSDSGPEPWVGTMEATARRTFVLVDGENIDATLGTNLLNRRPQPEERPRWERVTDYAAELWGQPVTGLFFLNASSGQLPGTFVQALLAMDYGRSSLRRQRREGRGRRHPAHARRAARPP